MGKRKRAEYPVDWVRVCPNVDFAQAKNCLLYIQVGSVGVMFGVGTRPKGYGARLELFTSGRKFRARRGTWHEMTYSEREAWERRQASNA